MKITGNFQSQAKRIALISKKRLFDFHYQKFFFDSKPWTDWVNQCWKLSLDYIINIISVKLLSLAHAAHTHKNVIIENQKYRSRIA